MLRTLKKRLMGRSCREVSRLISDMQERPLTLWERMVLRMHLGICHTCNRYVQQVRFLHQAMGRWKNYGDEP